MGERGRAVRWRRYQRGLRTIPALVVLSIAVWALAGGGYFWPKWVILWAAIAMTFRAVRAMRDGPPEDDEAVGELEPAKLRWPPTRSACGYADVRRNP